MIIVVSINVYAMRPGCAFLRKTDMELDDTCAFI
jgi:hypothetical protein